MPIKLGNTDITKLYLGTTELSQAYLGTVPLFSVNVLWLDEFTTDESPPITSPRTAEPGPGTAVITDTANRITLSGGRAVFAIGGSDQWNDPRINSQNNFNRATGLAFTARVEIDNASYFLFGMSENQGHSGRGTGWYGNQDNFIYATRMDTGAQTNVGQFVTGTVYNLCVVFRSEGAFIMIKGGAFTDWQLLWLDIYDTTATSYIETQLWNAARSYKIDRLSVSQINASPWNNDNGIRVGNYPLVPPLQTFTHPADFIMDFIIQSVPSTGYIGISFRRQDNSNYWQLRVNNIGWLELYEVVGGSPTLRGTSAQAPTTNDRIVVIAAGTTISAYLNTTIRIIYTAANNFVAQVDGCVDNLDGGSAIIDLTIWPRDITGTAADLLDTVAGT